MIKIEFIPLLNLCSLIAGLTTFGQPSYITLAPCFLLEYHFAFAPTFFSLNPLTPNDPYSGRTALLTSKVAFYIFIQQI